MAVALKSCVSLGIAAVAINSILTARTTFGPECWPIVSVCIWLLFLVSKGWPHLENSLKLQVVGALVSAAAFSAYLEFIDPEFQGWGDVFYFCGKRFQFCTCSFHWNVLGWYKAMVISVFVLLSGTGARNLILQVGLGGMLPGEEHIDKESLISICWRLIPYWLNNWEQQWGAECSSMLFELPHFAVELLVVLPLVQVICRRLRILTAPHVRVPEPIMSQLERNDPPPASDDANPPPAEPIPAPDPANAPPPQRNLNRMLVADVVSGEWELDEAQGAFWPRLRANARPLLFCAVLASLAMANSLHMPLLLERQTYGHPRTQLVFAVATDPGISSGWLQPADHWLGDGLAAVWRASSDDRPVAWGVGDTCATLSSHFQGLQMRQSYMFGSPGRGRTQQCSERPNSAVHFDAAMLKHVAELHKMSDPKHTHMILVVEAALAIMRLSCEGFFVLLAVYMAYLIRTPARLLSFFISLASRTSFLFQCTILYVFPAICWLYGAGFLFSLFVSVIFWSWPVIALWEFVGKCITIVAPQDLMHPDESHIERMGHQCAICWSALTLQPGSPAATDAATRHGNATSPSNPESCSIDSRRTSTSVRDHPDHALSTNNTPSPPTRPVTGPHDSAGLPQDSTPESQQVAPPPSAGMVSSPGAQSVELGPDRAGLAAEGPAQSQSAPSGGAMSPPRRRLGLLMTSPWHAGAEPARAAQHASGSRAVTAWLTHSGELVGEAPDPDALPPPPPTASSGSTPPLPPPRPPCTPPGSPSQHVCAACIPPRLEPVSSSSLPPQAHPFDIAHPYDHVLTRGDSAGARAGTSPEAATFGSRAAAADDCGLRRSAPRDLQAFPLDAEEPSSPGAATGAAVGAGAQGEGQERTAPEDAAGEGAAEQQRASLRLDPSSCGPSMAVALPCGHAFHYGCIMQWLRQCSLGGRPSVCPMCQAAVAVQTQLSWGVWFEGTQLGAGAGEGGLAGAADDRGNAAAGPPVLAPNHIRVDFLDGHMPHLHTLHLQHHPHAPPPHQAVPFVVRWRKPASCRPAEPPPPRAGEVEIPPPPPQHRAEAEPASQVQHPVPTAGSALMGGSQEAGVGVGHRDLGCTRGTAASISGNTNVES